MEYLANLVTNRKAGVQTGHRFLENHADAIAADFPHGLGVKAEQVFVFK